MAQDYILHSNTSGKIISAIKKGEPKAAFKRNPFHKELN